MTKPQARPGVLRIARYVQGKSVLPHVAEPIKLSSNESALGPSPDAVQAYLGVAGRLHRYPDGAQTELREAIAEVHGLEAEQIVCGNGSDEIINLLIRAYVGPGDEVVLSQHHFEMCPIHANIQGAEVVIAAERDFAMDVDALLAAVSSDTKAVILANPNNPTGTYLNASEVRRLHGGLPSEVLLILDGAYAEFVARDDYESGAALVRESDNVVMTRSFSKAYGLAALRIGWAYCPGHIAEIAHRVRTPFNANAAAMAAAAAAVRDRAHLERVKSHNSKWLKRMREALGKLGYRVVPSVTNFYLLDFDAGALGSAADAAAFLESRGVIARPVSPGKAENILRISIGLDHENEAVIAALREFLERPPQAASR